MAKISVYWGPLILSKMALNHQSDPMSFKHGLSDISGLFQAIFIYLSSFFR